MLVFDQLLDLRGLDEADLYFGCGIQRIYELLS